MNTTLIKAQFGLEPSLYPHVYERLAIDITGGLRSADVGLRGFRNRGFLARLWGGVTGSGQELQAQIGQDLLTVQRATMSVVQEIMQEEIRTRACVAQVVHNLQAVGHDIDELGKRTETLRTGQERLKLQLYQAIKQESEMLMGEIDGMRRDLSREKVTRRLTDCFQARALYPGMGPLLESAHFLASIGWLHAGTPEGPNEWMAALMIVGGRLGSNAPQPLEEPLFQTASEVQVGLVEAASFTLGAPTTPTCGLLQGLLLNDGDNAQGALPESLASQREAPNCPRLLQRRIVRPMDLVETIGNELQARSDGGFHE